MFDIFKKAYATTSAVCKEKAPEIFIGVGIVGVITATVIACKKTPQAVEIVKTMDEDIEKINKDAEPTQENPEGADPKAVAKERTKVRLVAAKDLAKTYGIAVAVGVSSVACILYSHKILRDRNAALVVAYNALDVAYKTYKEKVVEKVGPEVEQEIRQSALTEIREKYKDDPVTREEIEKEFSYNLYSGDIHYLSTFDKTVPSHVDGYNQAYLSMFLSVIKEAILFVNDHCEYLTELDLFGTGVDMTINTPWLNYIYDINKYEVYIFISNNSFFINDKSHWPSFFTT